MDLAETMDEAPDAAERKAAATAAAKRAADPLLEVEDIAARLNLKPRTVRDMMHAGYVPGFKVRGKKWKCRRSIYDQWEREQHVLIRSKAQVAEEKQQLFGGGRN